MRARRRTLLSLSLWAVIAARADVARAGNYQPYLTHLVAGTQVFDATLDGLSAYLQGTKTTNPELYAQLAPHLERLQSRNQTALLVLAGGVALGAASTVYAFASTKDCHSPNVNDPMFAADVDAWSACNDSNARRMVTFTFIGVGSLVAGGLAWMAIRPGRSDILDFINENNRVSREPLHLQIGYDPIGHLAYGGATLTF